MIGLKKEFAPSSLTEWVEQLKKDLKGDEFSKLERNDLIEELAYPTFAHQESREISEQTPGKFPFTRGLKTKDNNWNNGSYLHVGNESSANKKALEVLMKGADLLIFDVGSIKSVDWKTLLNGIELQYIQSQFLISSHEHYKSLRSFLNGEIPSYITLNIDTIGQETDPLLTNKLIEDLKNRQFASLYVDGASIQQTGATTWQEIGFCLSSGHEYLSKLIENGLSIDEAAACIHFSIGTGSNYFYEIAKIRALKQLWAALIKQYNPQHNCSYNCRITAHSGFMNKSLIDPYTNLLRQSTEAMSAASGGVDAIVIHPYDSCSVHGASALAERMALNISLILKEESYFDAVIDPLGGSYAMEELTDLIAEKGWSCFRKLEELGGMSSSAAIDDLCKSISVKAEMRIEEMRSGKKILIGINKFDNPAPEKNTFKELSSYLGLPKLILEQTLISVQ
jgi:methylmalonyl-CoA mutase